MRRLIGLEIRRWFARRLLWIFSGLIVLASVITALSVFFTHAATSEEDIAARERAYEDCYELRIDPGFEIPPEELQDERFRDSICRSFAEQLASSDRKPLRLSALGNAWTGTTGPLTAMVLVLAASFIGAEWRAGSLATQLTWEARRARLLVVKAGVAIAMGAAFFLAAQALIGLSLAPTLIFRGATDGPGGAWFWGYWLGLVGRGTAFAAMGAAAGFAFASVGRNTAASLGVMFGYIALAEGFLINLIGWLRPWLVLPNAIVFVGGRSIPDEFFSRTPLQSGLVLGFYSAAVIAIATAWFARRDVT